MYFRSASSSLSFFCIACLTVACTQTYAKREIDFKTVAIERATGEIAEDHLLDVRIKSFSPGTVSENEDEKREVSEEIRRAESYYMAVKVRNAMQQSGYWVAVRVVPNNGDTRITGTLNNGDTE